MSRERARLGASLEEVARRAKLDPETVGQWEQFGLKVPKEHAPAVQGALWSIQHERVMAASGLPECEWMKAVAVGPDPPAPEVVEAHVAECEVCRARVAYARKHAPRMPGPAGWLDLVVATVRGLPAPLAAAATGFLMILLATGIPIVFFLVSGIVLGDLARIGMAGGLLAVTAVAGGAGGLVYFATGRLRDRGALGHTVSLILVIYGYLAGAGVCMLGLDALQGGSPGSDADDIVSMLRDPVGLGVFLLMGVFFGAILSRGMRKAAKQREDGKAPQPVRRGKASLAFRRFALPVVALLALGLQWWTKRADRETAAERAPTVAEAKSSLPSLEETARARPGDPLAQYQLGMALGVLGRLEAALGPLGRAAKQVPRNPAYANAYGWCLLRLGRYQESLKPLRRAVKRAPKWVAARENLGFALAQLGQVEQATEALEAAVATGSADPLAHGMLGDLYVAQHRFAQGLVEARTAARDQPTVAAYRETEAQALLGLHRMDEALDQYGEAARLAPQQAPYWLELGRMAQMVGHYAKADSAFSRVQQLVPDYFKNNAEDRGLRDEARRMRTSGGSSR